jgi:hypothetical protein
MRSANVGITQRLPFRSTSMPRSITDHQRVEGAEALLRFLVVLIALERRSM